MSAKSILEADGKAILNYHLTRAPVIKPTPLPPSSTHNPPPKLATIHFEDGDNIQGVLDAAETKYPWLLAPGAKFVAKPDQLIKRRGKSGLLALNKSWADAKAWIADRALKVQKVETVDGILRNFLVEPFVPHAQECEYYICIQSVSLQNICNYLGTPTDFAVFRSERYVDSFPYRTYTHTKKKKRRRRRRRKRHGKAYIDCVQLLASFWMGSAFC
jgi:hypothetical protein